MEMLNVKLDRAVEAVKIKPSINLKDMQKNEKLVAVNERVEEAMNYRKELKILEIKLMDKKIYIKVCTEIIDDLR